MGQDLVPLSIRVTRDDIDRLDRLAGLLPVLSKTALAREALRRGLELLEQAEQIEDPVRRAAELAGLTGMVPRPIPGRPRRKS